RQGQDSCSETRRQGAPCETDSSQGSLRQASPPPSPRVRSPGSPSHASYPQACPPHCCDPSPLTRACEDGPASKLRGRFCAADLRNPTGARLKQSIRCQHSPGKGDGTKLRHGGSSEVGGTHGRS